MELFSSCFESNLNGEYFSDPNENGYYRGIIWELWLGDYSLKGVKMMIRPKNFMARSGPSVVPPDPQQIPALDQKRYQEQVDYSESDKVHNSDRTEVVKNSENNEAGYDKIVITVHGTASCKLVSPIYLLLFLLYLFFDT